MGFTSPTTKRFPEGCTTQYIFPLCTVQPFSHSPSSGNINQSTMQLSTQLETSIVFKSNGLFLLNLDPNLKISFQSGKKLQKYCEKNDSLEYLSKMSYLLPKNLLRVSGNPEIWHTTKLTRAQKITSK